MTDTFTATLRALVAANGIAVTDAELVALQTHHELLGKWAKKMNLTTVTENVESARLHFADSLLFAPMLPDACDGRVLDVGSGAGFPGMVLAVVRSDLQWTLLEPTRKRASFLRVVRAELGLDNVEILEGRLEPDPQRSQLGFVPGAIVSRATLPPPELAARSAGHLEAGGFLVASGGAQYPAVEALLRPGLVHEERREFDLGDDVRRTLDRFTRIEA